VTTVYEALAAVMADVDHVAKREKNTVQRFRAEVIASERGRLRYKRTPFWERVLVGDPGSCWEWLGAIGNHGYGVLGDGRLAHRVAYELLREPIPLELTVDHLCLTKLCCNPMHMEVTTRSENSRRGEKNRKVRSGGGWMALRPACKNGHVYQPGSYRMDGRRRVCLACQSARMATFKERRRT
jgi:hypothetical protein